MNLSQLKSAMEAADTLVEAANAIQEGLQRALEYLQEEGGDVTHDVDDDVAVAEGAALDIRADLAGPLSEREE